MEKHSGQKKGHGGMLFSLALGAALAAGAGYYATHKQEVDKEAKKRIDQLAKMYKENRPQVEKRVRQVWGKVSDDAIATYMDMKAAVLEALEEENMEKTGKALQEAYDNIVDSVVAGAKKAGVLDENLEDKVTQMFKQDWQKVGKTFVSKAGKVATDAKKKVQAVQRGAKKAAKPATKSVKKAVKKVAKKNSPAKKAMAAKKIVKKAINKAVKKVGRR